jgi:hypothetical protein
VEDVRVDAVAAAERAFELLASGMPRFASPRLKKETG